VAAGGLTASVGVSSRRRKHLIGEVRGPVDVLGDYLGAAGIGAD